MGHHQDHHSADQAQGLPALLSFYDPIELAQRMRTVED
jgi:hypothetical protein